MKISYKPTAEEVKKKRKERYLSDYPIEAQLEALTEAAMGNKKKLKEFQFYLHKRIFANFQKLSKRDDRQNLTVLIYLIQLSKFYINLQTRAFEYLFQTCYSSF